MPGIDHRVPCLGGTAGEAGLQTRYEKMRISIFTTKTESLYCACSPEWGVISYGGCQDEALNNLTDEVRLREQETIKEANHAK